MLHTQSRKRNRQPITGVSGFFVRGLERLSIARVVKASQGRGWFSADRQFESGMDSLSGRRRRGKQTPASKVVRFCDGNRGAGVAPCPLSNLFPVGRKNPCSPSNLQWARSSTG